MFQVWAEENSMTGAFVQLTPKSQNKKGEMDKARSKQTVPSHATGSKHCAYTGILSSARACLWAENHHRLSCYMARHMAICTPQMQRLAGSMGQKPSQLGRVHEATPIPQASWQESLSHLIQSYKSNFCGAGT